MVSRLDSKLYLNLTQNFTSISSLVAAFDIFLFLCFPILLNVECGSGFVCQKLTIEFQLKINTIINTNTLTNLFRGNNDDEKRERGVCVCVITLLNQ